MTFANRWRVLQQQMIQFGSTVGTIFINAFKPVLRVLNRVMDAAIQFAETVLNALGAIFGWTYEISGAGITDDLGEMATDMGDVASGAGDTASGLGDAAKNAAKLKTQLQSFDKLNNLSSPNESGSGGSGGSGGGGGGGAGGAGGGSGALQIARHTGEGIIKAYESAIKDLEGLGRYISTSLRDALRNVDWDKVYAGAESFGAGLAKFLNGLIRPDTFYEVGRAIANSLNTVLRSALSFADNFNFKNLGESINAEFLGFFQNFDWDTAKKAVKSWAKGFADIINGFISPDMFKEMGKALAELLSTLWGGLNSFFKELDFSEFGPALVAAIVGFLTNVDWVEIVNSLLATIESAFELLLGLVVGVVEEIPWRDIWEGIKDVLGEFDLSDALKGVMSLGEKVGKWIGEGIKQFFRDHPRLQILADVLGINFEDDIPPEQKVAEDGTLEVEHANSSHISEKDKDITGGTFHPTHADSSHVPQGDRDVPKGTLKLSSLNQSGLSGGSKTVPNGTLKLGKNGLNQSLVNKSLKDRGYTLPVKYISKARGFTAFTLSGVLKPGAAGRTSVRLASTGGVFDKGKWSKIPQFADGGVPFPVHGSMFIAGEAGPELVGHVGGRTEVLNASQIAVAVSDGVARANNSVVNALAAQNRILVGILEKKTGISSKDIFSAVRAEAANYQLRTGTPAFQ